VLIWNSGDCGNADALPGLCLARAGQAPACALAADVRSRGLQLTTENADGSTELVTVVPDGTSAAHMETLGRCGSSYGWDVAAHGNVAATVGLTSGRCAQSTRLVR